MTAPALRRELGLVDAVVIGLGSMVGAGVFAVWQPAAAAAGDWLLLALAVAALVATCNALSSASLAALYPQSGGTYVYGRERLGELWGYLAGWAFVIGKTASCAAMAMTFGAYVLTGHEAWLGIAAVVAITALNLLGAQRSARVLRVSVAVVLLALLATVVTLLAHPGAVSPKAPLLGERTGVTEAAALLFFAFAGYARIATMGEEVRDPRRTIPRAIVLALGIALTVYVAVAAALLHTLGVGGLTRSAAPLRDAADAAGAGWLVPALVVAVALATAGALLNLLLGVSRTLLAMARDGWFHRGLARIGGAHPVPWAAELLVAAVVVGVVAGADLRGAIGFSSFGVLTYYAVANASAMTLGGRARSIGALGLLGCIMLAAAVPWTSLVAGLAVLAVGLIWFRLRRDRRVSA